MLPSWYLGVLFWEQISVRNIARIDWKNFHLPMENLHVGDIEYSRGVLQCCYVGVLEL